MRVLVTGAFGYVGSAVVGALTAEGHEVRALTTRRDGAPHPVSVASPSGAVEVVHGDVRDPEAMRQAVTGVDGVCHLAALTRVREAAERAAEYRDVNEIGTATVVAAAAAEAARSGRAVRFALASSGAVYGAPSVQPIPESLDLALTDTHAYGVTKRAAERVVLDAPLDGRFGAVVLRVFNAAGASVGGRIGDVETILPKAMAVAAGSQPCLTVNGDGTAVRDFVHVHDVARAFAAALAYARPDRRTVLNVGAVGASVLDIVDAVRTVSGHPVPVEHRPSRGEVPILLADTRRIRDELGWSPTYDELEAIVADAWLAKNRD
ncbi:UDP-glucose 4-epimerase [Actinospica durhamensis]|uniref:UDP-glucose 4-epimerase n=1 Tax=Actinospica durhamensis TaxID=1508375 RepID=A0A941EY84_9ACTN|nr:NAD-dependent epimerase/dehydratase family protein [Actinospica durhamensis]MBR7838653.1 UDP-glucose 4-epimerase [Actinospica durhamensis]